MSIPAQAMAGCGVWLAAIVVYSLGVFLTMGKPTQAYATSAIGHLRYGVLPWLLFYVAAGLVFLGVWLFGHAAYRRLRHRG